jgi:hypothetical protein
MPPFGEIAAAALGVFGVSWIIADSKISLPFRRFVAAQLGADSLLLTLLECPPCLSFWLGLASAFLLHWARFAVVMAPLCTAVSLVLWAYVEKTNRA